MASISEREKKLQKETAEFEKAKAEFEKAVKFAKALEKQMVNDPNNTSKNKTTSLSRYNKETMLKWLESPGTRSNAKNLRTASQYLYNASNHYQRLINYYAGMMLWVYYITPLSFDREKVKPDAFRKQYFKVTQYLEEANIPHEMYKMCVIALRDGAAYGVFRRGKNSSFIQQLDPQYCQITSITDGTYGFSYQMSQVDEEDLDAWYPPEFKKMYQAYQNGEGEWQEVPMEVAFCLKADDSIDDYTIPLFASVMPLLLDIQNYMALQETATELQNYKLITGNVPLNDDGTPKIDWNLVQMYASHIMNALPPQVGLAVAPWKLEAINLSQQSANNDVDIVSRSIDNFWTTSGTPPTLHGSAIETSGGLEKAIVADEMLSERLMLQAERIFNRYLKTLGGSVMFKIKFLPVTKYNQEKMVKIYKEGGTYGMAKTLYYVAMGIPQYDLSGLSYIENNISHLEELIPLQSSHTMSGDEQSAGRPELDTDDISDEGARSKDNR